MFGLGGAEIALLLGIGVLLFGNKLPQVGGNLAKTIRSFRNVLNGVEEEIESSADVRRPAIPTPPERMPLPPERMPPPKFEGPRDETASPAI
jgi:TatA/E family protein of Tat protein translocase